jgi:hypothetical protein
MIKAPLKVPRVAERRSSSVNDPDDVVSVTAGGGVEEDGERRMAMMGDVLEVSVAEPDALVAVTTTLTVLPTSLGVVV